MGSPRLLPSSSRRARLAALVGHGQRVDLAEPGCRGAARGPGRARATLGPAATAMQTPAVAGLARRSRRASRARAARSPAPRSHLPPSSARLLQHAAGHLASSACRPSEHRERGQPAFRRGGGPGPPGADHRRIRVVARHDGIRVEGAGLLRLAPSPSSGSCAPASAAAASTSRAARKRRRPTRIGLARRREALAATADQALLGRAPPRPGARVAWPITQRRGAARPSSSSAASASSAGTTSRTRSPC